MDGVIVDSEKYWKKAELTFFGELLTNWTKEDQQKIIGISVFDTYKLLKNNYGLEISQESFLEQVNEIAIRVYKEHCNLLDGFLDFIEKCKMLNAKIALASSSTKSWIKIVLDRFDLNQFFDVIVSADEVGGKGKPAPDIYLNTAAKLNIIPQKCIVIEDSKHGTTAAKAANMFCIGLRNGFNEMQDLSEADVQIKGFKTININMFISDL